jgi:hypothetical protein
VDAGEFEFEPARARYEGLVEADPDSLLILDQGDGADRGGVALMEYRFGDLQLVGVEQDLGDRLDDLDRDALTALENGAVKIRFEC